MDVSFSDYIISLETFIENKANSGEKISKEDFTNRSHYCSLIKYINLLHTAVERTVESDSCFDRELLDYLNSVRTSVFKLFEKKCQQSDDQLPEVPIDTLELEERLKRLKENDIDLPDVPVESVGIEELEKRLNELRTVDPVRKTTSTKQQDILSKLEDSIISNPRSQNIQQIQRASERATEYNIHAIVEKINTYLRYLNIKGIHSKLEKYLFAEWLRVCYNKYIAEGKKNWVKWIVTQVPLTRR